MATLGEVVQRTLAVEERLDVLIVDDGSPDGTGDVADHLAADSARISVLHRPGKAGLGSAYRAGLGWGLQQDYEFLFEMDADLSHDPADLSRLLHALGGTDVAVGSRHVPGGAVVDWPRWRLALSRAGNRYVQVATGLPLADATAGFRGFRRAVLDDIGLATVRSEGYAFQLETALRAWRAGFRIVEVPITFVERREGASNMDRRIVVEAFVRVARWGLRGPRGPAGVHPASMAAAHDRHASRASVNKGGSGQWAAAAAGRVRCDASPAEKEMDMESAPERVVLGKREDSMVGFRWSGNEPEALNDVDLAEQFGAFWEGDELVHYDMDSLRWQAEHYEEDEYLTDND